MTEHKPYCKRDHTVSKKAKSLRAAFRSTTHGKPTNVGDPNDGASAKKV